MDAETRHRFLVALGLVDGDSRRRQARLRVESELAGATRHKAPPPHVQSSHGRRGPKVVTKLVEKAAPKAPKARRPTKQSATPAPTSTPHPLTRQAALDATPAKLTRPTRRESNRGDYSSAKLDGPAGMGSAESLAAYEGTEYEVVNGYLRHGPIDPTNNLLGPDFIREKNAEIAGWVADIDQTMTASRLAADVHVERVIRHGAEVFGRDAWYGDVIDFSSDDFDEQDRQAGVWESGVRPNLTGLRWREDAYVSTTADPEIAPLFGARWPKNNSPMDGEPVILTIRVPAGTGAAQLSEFVPDKQTDRGAAEILLERGLTMEVVADNGVDDAGFRRLDVQVMT